MGFETARFLDGEVDDELLCPVCRLVLEDPVQAPTCEHAFCRLCIEEWLRRQNTCPVDRQAITAKQLAPAPRILRNLLNRLLVACDNQQFGCTSYVRLDALSQHLRDCEHNPERPVICDQGCGLAVPQGELSKHSCLRDLRRLVETQDKRLEELTEKLARHQILLQAQECEIRLLKDAIRNINNDAINSLAAPADETERWAATLPAARISRWGGIISTPDSVLQQVIKRSLLEVGCPANLATELMERAHERHWPTGLRTLDVRQANRHQYEHYVCRRVPCKQAVVILLHDNAHMPANLMVEPGLVMIFAHGVE